MSLATWRRIGSPGYPLDVDRVRRMAGIAYDRRYDPRGGARQFAAILGTPDRTARLRQVSVPTLVLHGEADPLIGVSGGRATAAAIPGSRLVTFPGMGHDLPEALWPRFVEEITAVVALGEATKGLAPSRAVLRRPLRARPTRPARRRTRRAPSPSRTAPAHRAGSAPTAGPTRARSSTPADSRDSR